jgi:anti-anti-sigma factor
VKSGPGFSPPTVGAVHPGGLPQLGVAAAWEPRPEDDLRCVVATTASGAVIELVGMLCMFTAPLIDATLQLLLAGWTDGDVVELDLAKLSFLDAYGLRSIVSANNELRSMGRRLVLTNPRGVPLRVLELAHLATAFQAGDLPSSEATA